LALARALTARIEIGRGPSTNCGQTSTIASVSSRRRLLALARNSSTSRTLVSSRRLLALARRLLALARPFSLSKSVAASTQRSVRNESSPRSAFASTRPPSTRSPSTPRVPYSYGFADAASTPDSPDRPPGENCARPLSHACDTSRNAPNAPSWPRSNVSRLQRHVRELWPMPLSNSAFGRC
jgi:hypothetical protein